MSRLVKSSKVIMMALIVVAFGMLCIPNAKALTIGITPESMLGYFVPGSTEPDLGYPLLYKGEVGDQENPEVVEEGDFVSSYETVFANEPLDPADATISYVSGQPEIGYGYDPLYLIVKDGAFGNYVFDLRKLYQNITVDGVDNDDLSDPYTVTNPYSWDGKDTLALTNFWDGTFGDDFRGAISHVSIRGEDNNGGGGGGGEVPEPATMLLLGSGLVGLAATRRKKRNHK